VKVDVNGTAVEEVYDTDDEDHIDEEMCLELKQSQQQLLMHDVNGQQVCSVSIVRELSHQNLAIGASRGDPLPLLFERFVHYENA